MSAISDGRRRHEKVSGVMGTVATKARDATNTSEKLDQILHGISTPQPVRLWDSDLGMRVACGRHGASHKSAARGQRPSFTTKLIPNQSVPMSGQTNQAVLI